MDAALILLLAIFLCIRGMNREDTEEIEDFEEESLDVFLNPTFFEDEDAFTTLAYELGFDNITAGDSGTGNHL